MKKSLVQNLKIQSSTPSPILFPELNSEDKDENSSKEMKTDGIMQGNPITLEIHTEIVSFDNIFGELTIEDLSRTTTRRIQHEDELQRVIRGVPRSSESTFGMITLEELSGICPKKTGQQYYVSLLEEIPLLKDNPLVIAELSSEEFSAIYQTSNMDNIRKEPTLDKHFMVATERSATQRPSSHATFTSEFRKCFMKLFTFFSYLFSFLLVAFQQVKAKHKVHRRRSGVIH